MAIPVSRAATSDTEREMHDAITRAAVRSAAHWQDRANKMRSAAAALFARAASLGPDQQRDAETLRAQAQEKLVIAAGMNVISINRSSIAARHRALAVN